MPINKSSKQLYHDIFLREIIEYLQRTHSPTKPTTISEVRFLGVTLDKLLIKYDKRTLSQQSGDFIIPNFYLPSFLLSKLYRLLPVQTDDYKKAFISAIATFSFSQSPEKSREVQKFVNYYRSQGLEDEKLLLSFITDEFFLNKFFDESQQDDFFESELNKKFSSIQNQFELAQDKLNKLENVQALTLEEQKTHKSRIKDQESFIGQLKENEKILSNELKKIQRKGNKNQDRNQLSVLDFIEENTIKRENERLRSENEQLQLMQKNDENLKRKLEREKYIGKILSQWRRSAWLMLIIFIMITLIAIIYVLSMCDWSVKESSIYIRQTMEDNFILTIIVTVSTIILNVFVFRSIYDKYYAHNNIKAYTDKIDIPNDMKPI